MEAAADVIKLIVMTGSYTQSFTCLITGTISDSEKVINYKLVDQNLLYNFAIDYFFVSSLVSKIFRKFIRLSQTR